MFNGAFCASVVVCLDHFCITLSCLLLSCLSCVLFFARFGPAAHKDEAAAADRRDLRAARQSAVSSSTLRPRHSTAVPDGVKPRESQQKKKAHYTMRAQRLHVPSINTNLHNNVLQCASRVMRCSCDALLVQCSANAICNGECCVLLACRGVLL